MKKMLKYMVALVLILLLHPVAYAQYRSEVWCADRGDGTFRNPVLHADYSDPDVVRVGDDYWMTASSFNCIPGLPILHSKDLVNWQLVGHALQRQIPTDFFAHPQHGRGVWAPCIKHHEGWFYIYWGDPDFGIYMVKSQHPCGRWSDPVLVKAGKGLIDPSPLWDDDGRLYLAHAWAGSRSGLNSIISLVELNAEGTACISDEVMIFDGNDGLNHTVEGAKLYKRNGWYYLFAPAGGVATGWQLVMRSRTIYGPYETRMVMAQNESNINGPHQGAWVETPQGESWFLHFQDKGPYGRIIHLNPMQWLDNDWCVIGVDSDGDGCGTPVLSSHLPLGTRSSGATPCESDEFNTRQLGLQWQWHANPEDWFAMSSGYGFLRLYASREPFINLWSRPNLLLQKFPAERFTATAKLHFASKGDGDSGNLLVMGYDYARLSITRRGEEGVIELITCHDADRNTAESARAVCRVPLTRHESGAIPLYTTDLWFRVRIEAGAQCHFSYSLDGKHFTPIHHPFTARVGKWIGAKVGLCCLNNGSQVDRGWMDVDWFRITKNDK